MKKINQRLLMPAAATIFFLGSGCVPGGGLTNWYFDNDLDGYGDLAIVMSATERPSGYVGNSRDCNDANAAINPVAIEEFDGIDNNCDGEIDNVAFWYADTDTDGYGDPNESLQEPTQPVGYVSDNTDCDDTNFDIHPGAAEVVNDEIDSNCNGLIDDVSVGDVGPAGGIVVYVDNVGGFGLEVAPEDQTGSPAYTEWGCSGTNIPGAEGAAIGTGAKNTDDIIAAGCTPIYSFDSLAADLAANYTLNGFDDWFLPSKDELNAVYQARGFLLGLNKATYWSSTEGDCSGIYCKSVAQSFTTGSQFSQRRSLSNTYGVRAVRVFHWAWYADADSDGYGDPLVSLYQFQQPVGYVANQTDCDDVDSATHPGALEVVNGIDNDCDGDVDELYDIGDRGPAGGVVFWLDETKAHGLEVAPTDQDIGIDVEWGCMRIDIPGAEGSAIGTGAQNTADMLAAACQPYYVENILVTDLVANYTLNGFNDWFLPSKDELIALYGAKDIVLGVTNGFHSSVYFSSTEGGLRYCSGCELGEGFAWSVIFKPGLAMGPSGSVHEYWKAQDYVGVRAIRAF